MQRWRTVAGGLALALVAVALVITLVWPAPISSPPLASATPRQSDSHSPDGSPRGSVSSRDSLPAEQSRVPPVQAGETESPATSESDAPADDEAVAVPQVVRRPRSYRDYQPTRSVWTDVFRWLVDHQEKNGSYSPRTFGTAGVANGRVGDYRSGAGYGVGREELTDAATALVLLGWAEAGYTYTELDYARPIKNAIRHTVLVDRRKPALTGQPAGALTDLYALDGVTTQALQLLALVRHTASSRSAMLRLKTKPPLTCLLAAQTVDADQAYGGWPTHFGSAGDDPLATALALLVMQEAGPAGFDVPEFESRVAGALDMLRGVPGLVSDAALHLAETDREGQHAIARHERLVAALAGYAGYAINPLELAVAVHAMWAADWPERSTVLDRIDGLLTDRLHVNRSATDGENRSNPLDGSADVDPALHLDAGRPGTTGLYLWISRCAASGDYAFVPWRLQESEPEPEPEPEPEAETGESGSTGAE